jgi:hypothetical protein
MNWGRVIELSTIPNVDKSTNDRGKGCDVTHTLNGQELPKGVIKLISLGRRNKQTPEQTGARNEE